LQAVNTWTHEVGDFVELGSAPTRGILTADAGELFVSDSAGNRIVPVDIQNRHLFRSIEGKIFSIPTGDSPGALRFDPVDPGMKPNLLLVVNQGSGDLSVIRARTYSVLTMIPVGEHPLDIAVKLF
jgi:YVTN family beta-propeller protein